VTAHQQQLLSELREALSRVQLLLASMELIDGIQDGFWFAVGREQIDRGFTFVERAVQRLDAVEAERDEMRMRVRKAA